MSATSDDFGEGSVVFVRLCKGSGIYQNLSKTAIEYLDILLQFINYWYNRECVKTKHAVFIIKHLCEKPNFVTILITAIEYAFYKDCVDDQRDAQFL